MAGRNMAGILLTNFQDSYIPELTTLRTFSSIPFGAKYRLIDFSLSNMVNSGISKIGVVTKNNYLSLMDHIGSGKAWNLSRRRGGLTFLPPFENTGDKYNNFVQTIDSIRDFINNCYEDYLLISSSMNVVNIDYQQMFNAHLKNNADITMHMEDSDSLIIFYCILDKSYSAGGNKPIANLRNNQGEMLEDLQEDCETLPIFYGMKEICNRTNKDLLFRYTNWNKTDSVDFIMYR